MRPNLYCAWSWSNWSPTAEASCWEVAITNSIVPGVGPTGAPPPRPAAGRWRSALPGPRGPPVGPSPAKVAALSGPTPPPAPFVAAPRPPCPSAPALPHRCSLIRQILCLLAIQVWVIALPQLLRCQGSPWLATSGFHCIGRDRDLCIFAQLRLEAL